MNRCLPAFAALLAAAAAPLAAADESHATFRGRLVEADGQPAANLAVTLIEYRSELTATFGEDAFDDLPADSAELLRATTRSDADGRFELPGASAERLHLLGIDLGAARATLRLIDQSPARGSVTEIGDVMLAAGVTLRGRVVDREKRPLAGVRVRALPAFALPLLPALLDLALREQRPDRPFLAAAPGAVFLERPRWAASLEAALPLPTTLSAADGSFELPHVAFGRITLSLDHAGFVAVSHTAAPSADATQHDFGELLLSPGATARFQLRAGDQLPIGARVHAGPAERLGELGIAAFGRELGSWPAGGEVELDAVPIGAETLLALQRHAGGPAQVLGPFAGDRVEVALPPVGAVELRVRDASGAPRDDVEFRFMVLGEAAAPLRGFGQPWDLDPLVQRESEGRYRLRDLPLGDLMVLARAPGSGFASKVTRVAAEPALLELALPVEVPRRLQVVDPAGEPIAGAEVTALSTSSRGIGDPIGFALTDATGHATLRHLQRDLTLVVRVAHRGHCALVHADPAQSGAETLRVELPRGGRLEGRVVRAAASSAATAGSVEGTAELTVALRWSGPAGAPEDQLPRFAIVQSDGTFALPHLRPGPWQLDLHPRLARLGPAELAAWFTAPPRPLLRQTVRMVEGETVHVELSR